MTEPAGQPPRSFDEHILNRLCPLMALRPHGPPQ
jgi:hypothetical protein